MRARRERSVSWRTWASFRSKLKFYLCCHQTILQHFFFIDLKTEMVERMMTMVAYWYAKIPCHATTKVLKQDTHEKRRTQTIQQKPKKNSFELFVFLFLSRVSYLRTFGSRSPSYFDDEARQYDCARAWSMPERAFSCCD